MHSLAVFGVLLGFCLIVQAAKLPSSWGKCERKSSDFSECLRKNIELAVTSLNKPTPQLGLTTFDPLDIPELYIGEGTGSVNVEQHFKNVKLHGLTNVKVSSAKFDWDNKILVSESLNPELRLQADYVMKGRVLLLPIVGDGPCNVTLVNMKIRHLMSFDYIEKKGKKYIKCTDFRVTMNPEKVIFKFDNLFNGENPELSNNVNTVLNDNNADVFNDVREGYEKSFGIIFKDMANRVLSKVPIENIFLN